MSASAQTNGKKSSCSTAVNTPSSTPVANGNPQSISQSTPPLPNNNAPKYGTLIPNRIFVGGISANTTEGELLRLFSSYGTVKAAKIIQDRAGVSKGYGFITFENEEDAKRPLKDADNIMLNERRLNIAPAIKKQPFNRTFDASSPPAVPTGNHTQYFFSHSPAMPYYPPSVTYYTQPAPAAPGDPNNQPTTVYQAAPPMYSTPPGPPQAQPYPSMMFPQPLYMHQQYPLPVAYDYNIYSTNGGQAQYMVGGQNGPSSGSAGGAAAAASNAGPPTSSQGGGPPAMPPPNSPPRPGPCYNTGPMHYNPDAMFYNMQMYGAPVDGAAAAGIYPDGLDLSNGGYGEGPYLFEPLLQELEPPHDNEPPPPYDLTMSQPSHPPTPSLQQQQQQQPPPMSLLTIEGGPPSADSSDAAAATGRQTNTPVVSLLSMDMHQEKDLVSMQGGRRVKQSQQQPQQQQQAPPMVSLPPPFLQQQGPPLGYQHFTAIPPPAFSNSTNQPPPASVMNGNFRSHYPTYNKTANSFSNSTNGNNGHYLHNHHHNYHHNHHHNNNNGANNVNGWRNNRRSYYGQQQQQQQPRRNGDYYSGGGRNYNSSRGSHRNESDSSGTCTDETRSDDRSQASPGPATQTATNNGGNNYNSYGRSYNGPSGVNNGNNSRRNSAHKVPYHHQSHQQQQPQTPVAQPQQQQQQQQQSNDRNKQFVVGQQVRNGQLNFAVPPPPPPASAAAAANSRRPKRSNRRIVQPAASLSEIGGGDAPPLAGGNSTSGTNNGDVLDATCKKIENLKL